jgi:hypothetical protein
MRGRHIRRIEGNAPKLVSDALRWEIGRGRAIRVSRGTYEATVWPRSRTHRIRKRMLDLRNGARDLRPGFLSSMSQEDLDAFWEAYGD